ncbi:MAG: hypothetical protein KatS3mg095_0521 [Candidatus Parcubacteria bacterium]|nr:MAG: hypothetical protein KatS3mg095_0521 [Candidatus Parcubacteria bacterium]
MIKSYKLIIILSCLLSTFFLLPTNFLFSNEIPDYKIKLGQLFIFNITYNTDDKFIENIISKYKLGGFNFIGSYTDQHQVKYLIEKIKYLTNKNQLPQPFLAVDQEGEISRLKFIKSTPQRLIKSKNSAFSIAYNRGKLIKQLGFNMIFSPVLDFTSNKQDYIYPRTFQQSKAKTIDLASSMIEGYKKAGIISIPKHFPGYVKLNSDPHGKIQENLNLNDLQNSIDVFSKVINKTQPIGLMFAHIKISEFNNQVITRSEEFLNYSKNILNYNGLFITDSIGMKAFIENNKDFGEIALESIKAGYDILILPSNTKFSLEILNYLQSHIDDPEFQKSIDRSFNKIMKIKSENSL